MKSKQLNRVKSWLKRVRSTTKPSDDLEVESRVPNKTPLELHDPVNRYYQLRLKSNLVAFNHFAIQTRSLRIRDTYALAASHGRENLNELLSTLHHYANDNTFSRYRWDIQASYDCELLLALADLLANSARNDLDTYNAVSLYNFVLETYGEQVFHSHNKLQYVECLYEVSQFECLDRYAKRFAISDTAPLQEELLNIQKIRSLADSPAKAWVDAINNLYDSLHMSKIRLCNNDNMSLIDRLYTRSATTVSGPKVSVIMPTYSPRRSIHTAVRGLLEQTWENLEIIIVDDASPTEYQDLFWELEALDPRVQVLRQTQNMGAYVARNAGLAKATGVYVTTHDDDDWSHPDKIALQVGIMESDPNIVATTSSHIRTTQDMSFQRVNKRAQYLQMNYSSLLFRKYVADEIGAWDEVNRGGDSEFLMRIIENFGEDRHVNIDDKPLSFSRVWAGSLTSGEMSRGFFAYSRLLYRWSFRQWQWDVAKAGKRPLRRPGDIRPYAVPSTFEAGARSKDLGLFDVIYVTDFFRQSKFVDFVMADIRALVGAGYRVGYMHLYSPQTNRHAGFPKELFRLQREGKIAQVSHDDQATTRLLVVYDASIGMFLDQIRSTIAVQRAVTIDHKLPTLSNSEERQPTLMSQSLKNLDRAFDTSFQAIGVTGDDWIRLRNETPPRRLLSEKLTWHIHVGVEPTTISPPHSKPIVGFHSFGNIYRWPSNQEVFRSVYLSTKFATRLYGHVDEAIAKFGNETFQAVDVMDSFHYTTSEFLQSIDFWVYCPHPRLVDQVWGPVINAMQVGKVVILPPHLRPIYGDSAVYAESNEIEEVVLSLVGDPNAYTRQAERGRAFVANNFSDETFINRIAKLLEVSGSWSR